MQFTGLPVTLTFSMSQDRKERHIHFHQVRSLTGIGLVLSSHALPAPQCLKLLVSYFLSLSLFLSKNNLTRSSVKLSHFVKASKAQNQHIKNVNSTGKSCKCHSLMSRRKKKKRNITKYKRQKRKVEMRKEEKNEKKRKILVEEKVVDVTTGQAFLVAACGQVKKRVK